MFKISPLTAMLILILISLATAVFFVAARFVDSTSALGLLGVFIGAGISAATSILVSRENRHFQLAVAAIDKRLATHQAAYALWHKIVRSVHQKEKIADVVIEAEEWWSNNCLYLDTKSREDFRACLLFAFNHKSLLEEERSPETQKMIKESWSVIMKPGKTLVEGVALPSLGKDENPADTQ